MRLTRNSDDYIKLEQKIRGIMYSREFGPFSPNADVSLRFKLFDEAASKGLSYSELAESKLNELDQTVCKMIRENDLAALYPLLKAATPNRFFTLSWEANTRLLVAEDQNKAYIYVGRPSIEESRTYPKSRESLLFMVEQKLQEQNTNKGVRVG